MKKYGMISLLCLSSCSSVLLGSFDGFWDAGEAIQKELRREEEQEALFLQNLLKRISQLPEDRLTKVAAICQTFEKQELERLAKEKIEQQFVMRYIDSLKPEQHIVLMQHMKNQQKK